MAYDIVDLPDDERGYSFQNVLFESFTIKQLRSPFAREGEFIPFSVMQGDREVWSFMTHPKPPGFSGLVLLREVGDELVLMLANKRELYEVIPVRDLPNRKTIGGEAIGGRNLADLLAIKEMVANNEDLRPVWTKRELALWEAFKNRLSEQRQSSARAEETRRKQADQAKRLTDDTFAMCPKAGDEGRYAVFALTKGKAVPVTEVKRK